jgi:hypothetical protein
VLTDLAQKDVMLSSEQTSATRKISTPSPSMPAGSTVIVEVQERWINARVLQHRKSEQLHPDVYTRL